VTSRGLELWREPGRSLTEGDVEPGAWAAAQQGSAVPGRQYADGVDSLPIQGREIERWWEEEGWTCC
jgi:hypothetical protein